MDEGAEAMVRAGGQQVGVPFGRRPLTCPEKKRPRVNRLAMRSDSGPVHEALRRRVDAALSLPTAGLGHGVCDAVQRAVDAVCGAGLSREWADLFVTMARHTGAGGDHPERLLELARATRTFIDRV